AQQLGPSVLEDPDAFHAALEDVLDVSVGEGERNLLVDAVRLGGYDTLVSTVRHGGGPAAAVDRAGARLARDRGGEVTSASWAVACLGYAAGLVPVSEVRRRLEHLERPEQPGPTAAPPDPPP